ncbi:MAG: hypothetical protein NT009_09610 [Proteobacteria bacterium]|nr:hypothetical protein [Pseudomonadota bacterium]
MSEKKYKKEAQNTHKKPYEKPRIILEEKIEGRAGVCTPPGKNPSHFPACIFLMS